MISTSKTQHADIISKRQDNVRQGGQKAFLHPTLPDRGRHIGCGNGKDGRGGVGSAAGLQQEDSGRELATIPQLHGSPEDACPACLQRSGIQAPACQHLERRGIKVCPEASAHNADCGQKERTERKRMFLINFRERFASN